MTYQEPKSIILLMVQIDDASGELLGHVMGQLETLGAKNIQLLPSLTKKGRPGYVMMVDLPADLENAAAALFVGELGVWGYRVLHGEHKHFEIRKFKIDLTIEHETRKLRFPLRAKSIFSQNDFIRVKAEHDDLASICAGLAREGLKMGLTVLKARVENALQQAREPQELTICIKQADFEHRPDTIN